MNSIPVIFSFARSGGTLVNQLLGVHPSCLVLSEVNPAASVVPIERQAIEWLRLIDDNELEEFTNLSYAQQIAYLEQRALSKNKKLIIRDWVAANFLPGMGSDVVISSYILEQAIYLSHIGSVIHPLVITRRAVDVYQSVIRCFTQFKDMEPDLFLNSYMQYVNAVKDFPKISLEALQSSPREALADLLSKLEISQDFIDHQLNTFFEYQLCTGNNTLSIPSSSSRMQGIHEIKPESGHEFKKEVLEWFIEADYLMGYAS